jgi:hypothetical protein
MTLHHIMRSFAACIMLCAICGTYGAKKQLEKNGTHHNRRCTAFWKKELFELRTTILTDFAMRMQQFHPYGELPIPGETSTLQKHTRKGFDMQT